MAKRYIVKILPMKPNGWKVKHPTFVFEYPSETKKWVVWRAAYWRRCAWEDEGELSQLIIYKRNGQIQSERSYGRDPRRSKG